MSPDSKLISRAPTTLEKKSDGVFRLMTYGFAGLTVLVLLLILFEIGSKALPAISERGLGFVTGTSWNPNTN